LLVQANIVHCQPRDLLVIIRNEEQSLINVPTAIAELNAVDGIHFRPPAAQYSGIIITLY